MNAFLLELFRWTLAGTLDVDMNPRPRVKIDADRWSSMVFTGGLTAYRSTWAGTSADAYLDDLETAAGRLRRVLSVHDLPGDEAQALTDALRSLRRLVAVEHDPECV